MSKIITGILCAFLLLSNIAYGASSTPVKTDQSTLSLISTGYNDLGQVQAGLYFKLKKGWKIYWRDAGDTGFAPQFDWSKSTNVKSTEMLWPVPTRYREKLHADLYSESNAYTKEVVFPVTVVPTNILNPVKLSLHVNYAICKDICIPAQADLLLKVPAGYSSDKLKPVISKYIDLAPHENGHAGVSISSVALGHRDSGEQYLQITIDSDSKSLKKSDIFIEADDDFVYYNPKKIVSKDGKMAVFNMPITQMTDVTEITGKKFNITLANGKYSVQHIVDSQDTGVVTSAMPILDSDYTLGIILLFGLIGGLILNIMPCVLPVLSLKILGVIKSGSGDPKHITTSFIVTSLGIIASFIALAGIVIALRSAGINAGWGFHFQEPLFIISLVVILSLFAANLWGLFHIQLPSFCDSGIYKKSTEHSLIGYFLTGVLATILATPCTAPFLGVAVGFAIAGTASDILLTFTAMGIGMALPYLVFSLFPGLVSKLPKPGDWMIVVKNIMGILLAATAVWLIWVLSNQLGRTAALVLAILCCLKIIKLWAVNHVSFLAKQSVRIFMLGTIIILAFTLPVHMADVTDQSHLADSKNDIWQEFRPQDIHSLVKDGKVVFVDITADWCLTCKVNKFLVLENDDITKLFSDKQVVTMRGDWTNKNDFIAQYLTKHNRVGIPFNVVYGPAAPKGIVLSELLKKKAVKDAVERAGKK